jgi:KDO2-lipid IV(A) lauroyltransferase
MLRQRRQLAPVVTIPRTAPLALGARPTHPLESQHQTLTPSSTPFENAAQPANSGTYTERAEADWPVPWTPVEGTRTGVAAWLEYAAFRGCIWCAGLLPEYLFKRFVAGLARISRRLDSRHRESARVYLRQAFGEGPSEEEIEERVLQAYRHLIQLTIRSGRWKKYVLADDWHERCELELSPEFEALRGKGSIMICPHVGDWEVAGAFLERLGYGPIYAIAKPPKNRPLSRHVQKTREGRGIRMLPRRGGIRHAARILAGGGLLGLMIDQRTRNRGVIVPFFGRPALCDRSAGVLLKRLKVPITIGAVCLTDKPYHVRIDAQTVLQPEDFARHSVEEIITRVNTELEALILKQPDQYLWLHDRYRDAPEK